ncbi:hypothetical protein KDA14_02530 [Candidatus Saccharibacteria bacterium]|nr:hypothetical protein [Candidatus Saccharibacteria bacterium]
MKIKQTKLLFIAFGLVFSTLLSFFPPVTSNVEAYVCSDPTRPTDIYEYHESDGMCWKVRYTDRQQDPPIATCNNGSCACPNNVPFLKNGACKNTCSAGDQYHIEDNSCWYKNGYTEEETQKVQPTKNDGTPISGNDAACTNNFVYLENGPSGAGCYRRSADGTFPCGPDQEISKAGPRGTVIKECQPAEKTHLIPKNKQQSSDKTKVNAACEQKYPGDEHAAERLVCQGAYNNPNQNCSNQPNDQRRDACKVGRETSTNPTGGDGGIGGTGNKCGEAETVIVSCQGQGVQALGDVLRIAVSVLTVLIGIAAVGGIAWAAILYAKAEDNQSHISEAKDIIRNVVIGIIVYGFLIAIVNWLVPGGVIG